MSPRSCSHLRAVLSIKNPHIAQIEQMQRIGVLHAYYSLSDSHSKESITVEQYYYSLRDAKVSYIVGGGIQLLL